MKGKNKEFREIKEGERQGRIKKIAPLGAIF